MTDKIIDEEELKKVAGGSICIGPIITIGILDAIKGGVNKDEILATIARYRGDFTAININRITEEFMRRFGENPFDLLDSMNH